MTDYTTSNKDKYCFSYADATYECIPAPPVDARKLMKSNDYTLPPVSQVYTFNAINESYPPYMPVGSNQLNYFPLETPLQPKLKLTGPPPREDNYFPYENQPQPPIQSNIIREGFIHEGFTEETKESKKCVKWEWFSDFDKICKQEYGPNWIYQGYSQTACTPGTSKILCKQNKLTKPTVPNYLVMNQEAPNNKASIYNNGTTYNAVKNCGNLKFKETKCAPWNLLDHDICSQTFGDDYKFVGKKNDTCISGWGKAQCARK